MPQTFPTVSSFAHYLDKLNFFHMDLSLSRMDRVLQALDLKNPPFTVVQVVGTNGKGSTATFLASLLEAHGIQTGLYTSPHFYSPAERVQIDGTWTDMRDWLEPAEKALGLCPELTYFELITVIALCVFRARNVRVAVLEAGLGAKFDATTSCAAQAVVYTPIALDHTSLLGTTIAAIADEKSHAIRGAVPVITAEQKSEAMAVLTERARAYGADISVAAPLPAGTKLGLCGDHQDTNAGTALAAFRKVAALIGLKPEETKISLGLERAFLPGRLQTVAGAPAGAERPARPACLLDGAHNPHGMTSLVAALAGGRCLKPDRVVYSCLHDKDWRGALILLHEQIQNAEWHIPAIPGERSEQPEVIKEFLHSLGESRISTHASCLEAFRALDGTDRPVLVTGSLYLLSEFYALWPDALRRPPRQ